MIRMQRTRALLKSLAIVVALANASDNRNFIVGRRAHRWR